MDKWYPGTQPPSAGGKYLVLVKLSKSVNSEFDIAEYYPMLDRWRTLTYIGTVIWWTKLPSKRQFELARIANTSINERKPIERRKI